MPSYWRHFTLSREVQTLHRIQLSRAHQRPGTASDIQGRTTPLPCELERFPFPQCFHVLRNLDVMDLVLWMDFLGKHDVTLQARKSQTSIAAQPGPIVLRAKPHGPTGPENTGAAIDLLNAARIARHCKLQDSKDQAFLGYINELVAATEPMLVARTDPQPPEYKRHEANLREEFKGILCDNIPPGLPPVCRLRDGRIPEHAIPLKPTARPEAKQPCRLSEIELTEVRTQITILVNQGWIRPSFSPWGAPVLL
jgi:hypothetical protein